MALFCFCVGLSPFALVTSIASVSFFTCHFAIKFVVLSSTFQLLSIRLFISKLFSIVGNALLFCYCCDCNVCTRIGCAARLLWRVYFLYSSFVSLSRTHTHTLVLIIRQRRTVNLILNSPEQPRVFGSLRLSGTALGLRLKQFFFLLETPPSSNYIFFIKTSRSHFTLWSRRSNTLHKLACGNR